MTAPTLFRITDTYPYLDREEEYAGLTLEEAAHRMDDLTGVGADVIMSDWGESCPDCGGTGWGQQEGKWTAEHCATCRNTGKWPGPWKHTDEETGREVTMMREVG